ncbi:MAG: TlpA family protein disulfide reductase [Deltaproteobacteria bacterium]|nr:TlpA family protein disulfide reductase [Deltaproteobacteria bacterium]
MNRKRSFALRVFLFFSLFLAAPVSALEIGTTAPDFQLKTLDGRDVRLSDYQNRIILLKLGTVWCPSCQEVSKEICGLDRLLAKNNIVVIEVFLQDSESGIRDYLRNRDCGGFENVVVRDEGQVRQAYDVYLIPRLLFLDGDLRVRRDVSRISGREIAKEIEKIMTRKSEVAGGAE